MQTSTPLKSLIAAPQKKRGNWKRLFTGNFLVISIIVHLLLGVGATYWVVQTISKRKLTFKGGPPSPNPERRAAEHKVQLQKKQQASSAPAQAKRIATTGIAKVTLPDMPVVPSLSNNVTANVMAGMGGTGVGMGMGGSGNGNGTGGGGMPLFGLRKQVPNTLEGIFYDYKKEQNGSKINLGINEYMQYMKQFTKGSWTVHPQPGHFTSPTKLYARFFLFPPILSTEAGKAFQSPDSEGGLWMALYKGEFSSDVGGSYRFVGFGDNAMIVKSGGRVVLDASDHGYVGLKRENAGHVTLAVGNVKLYTPIFFGAWFELQKGQNRDISVLVGDEGGHFCAGLFIQKKDMDYKQGKNGIPMLPLFSIGQLTDGDKKALRKYLPDECLNGPFFPPQASTAKSSIFDPH
jgi:hypothetical protein